MAEQIHKRLSVEFVDEVMEAFNEQRVTERAVCEVLGIKRSRLYEIRKKWLRCKRRGEGFRLWDRSRSDFHKFPEEIEEWLHEELRIYGMRQICIGGGLTLLSWGKGRRGNLGILLNGIV